MEAIERLPEENANPVMVFESATERGSLVVLIGYKDKGERPVMVAVELNAPDKTSGYRINRVASAYGRVPAEYMRFIERGLLRYRNTAKSLEWLNDKGLQLPNSLSATQGSLSSVPTEDDVINSQVSSSRMSRIRFNPADYMPGVAQSMSDDSVCVTVTLFAIVCIHTRPANEFVADRLDHSLTAERDIRLQLGD